jgi:hypothetical protein
MWHHSKFPRVTTGNFQEHLQKGKLHVDLDNRPTCDGSGSVHTQTKLLSLLLYISYSYN